MGNRRLGFGLSVTDTPDILKVVDEIFRTTAENFIIWSKAKNLKIDEQDLWDQYELNCGSICKLPFADAVRKSCGMSAGEGLGFSLKVSSSSVEIIISDNTRGCTMQDLSNVVQWVPEEHRYRCGKF